MTWKVREQAEEGGGKEWGDEGGGGGGGRGVGCSDPLLLRCCLPSEQDGHWHLPGGGRAGEGGCPACIWLV